MPPRSPAFDPDLLFTNWSKTPTPPTATRSFASAIQTTFSLPTRDTYIYHAAPSSLSLAQAQSAVDNGGVNNLHAWYRDAETGEPLPPPPQADIEAYVRYFDPSTTPSKGLAALSSNAKRGSIRAAVAQRLQGLRVLPEAEPGSTEVKIARNKGFVNPAGDFWAFCCRELEWAGPIDQDEEAEIGSDDNTKTDQAEQTKQQPPEADKPTTPKIKLPAQSHHVVPVLMHHFGCTIPSWEALTLLTHTVAGRPILDIGSGNGYWTYMLRREGLTVTPIDDGQSQWRTMWIKDTISEDGASYLKKNDGGRGKVLLMVYPVTAGQFVERMVGAYAGEVVIVAGTVNRNGYTGFKDRKVGEWMQARGWKMKSRVPLPSFGGKDEGMEVFVR